MYWSQLQTLGQEAPITSSPIPAYISNIHIVEEDRHKAYTDKSRYIEAINKCSVYCLICNDCIILVQNKK